MVVLQGSGQWQTKERMGSLKLPREKALALMCGAGRTLNMRVKTTQTDLFCEEKKKANLKTLSKD